MKIGLLIVLGFSVMGLSFLSSYKTLYDFKVKTIEGKPFDLATLKGKKVLIVNTASECGYTPQYEKLEQLFKTYGGTKFIIIGFPANNFGGQEPGTNTEIAAFCKKNYGVTFPMMEKISVQGTNIHPLYEWLTKKELNGVQDTEVKWNFQKFLIDENGKWAGVAATKLDPMSEEITGWIKR